MAPTPENRAGRWGDYRSCGTPWESVEDALRAANAQHPDADMVYVTGDYVDHGTIFKELFCHLTIEIDIPDCVCLNSFLGISTHDQLRPRQAYPISCANTKHLNISFS